MQEIQIQKLNDQLYHISLEMDNKEHLLNTTLSSVHTAQMELEEKDMELNELQIQLKSLHKQISQAENGILKYKESIEE